MSVVDILKTNKIYLAYCRSKGYSNPKDMIERDINIYVGSSTTGFILWNAHHISEYMAIHYPDLTNADKKAIGRVINTTEYLEWLDSKYPLIRD